MVAYRLSLEAENDIVNILEASELAFGVPARRRYEALLTTAFRDVASAPSRPGSRRLGSDFDPDLR
jgi:toxin ParE1/3/4